MTLHAVLTYNFQLKIMEAPYRCFVLARNHELCISIAPERGSESRTNECESNALAIMVVRPILSGPSNITTIWYSINTRVIKKLNCLDVDQMRK